MVELLHIYICLNIGKCVDDYFTPKLISYRALCKYIVCHVGKTERDILSPAFVSGNEQYAQQIR